MTEVGLEYEIAAIIFLVVLSIYIVHYVFTIICASFKSPSESSGKEGHVYIISNEGSFGKNIFKVGMTRRSDPMIRVHELCDASVPFPFTVHAFIKTKDPSKLEAQFHKDLAAFRVNRVNEKKEFFCINEKKLQSIIKKRIPDVKFRKTFESREWKGSSEWNKKNRIWL